MPNDAHAFFHDATLQICSSLDLDESVVSSYEFLKNYLPLEGLNYNVYEPDLKAVRLVASHDRARGNALTGKLVALDPAGVAFIEEKMANLEHTEKTMLGCTMDESPVALGLQKAIGLTLASYVVLHLMVKEEKLGVVVVYSSQESAFTPEHADLLALLHDPFAIALSNALRYHEVLRLQELLKDDNRFLRRELYHLAGDEIVGQNFGLSSVMEMVRQVAALDSNVLLLGETGVGKEVIANAIHYSSPRTAGPLVKVNCGAIPESIIDSELFGHEKGAFTGAVTRKRGRFERAHHGTILLDEIAELPPAAQVRLLRVLQTREIERVGGTETVPVDVRVIAATHRNLAQMVQDGRFREDLWFRLNVFPITIPPLRQRKADIPSLVVHFIERKAREINLPYTPVPAPGALERLQDYAWPGNVRELENAVERELIRNQAQGPGHPLTFADFMAPSPGLAAPARRSPAGEPGPWSLDEVVRQHIRRALEKTSGKVQGPDGAAALLGLNASTLRHRMRKLAIAFGRAIR
ncbi:MAG: sigma 54-interacting transcriptional regulator [Deltaproteobacteria bacterium]|nr:sigma 54-interacting transcriptional regulator [Deltaproteobacteria bacterium]